MNTIALIILIFIITQFIFSSFLSRLSISHYINQSKQSNSKWSLYLEPKNIENSINYTKTNTKFSEIKDLVSLGFTILILYSGLLSKLLSFSIDSTESTILQGLLFFSILGMASLIIDIPFSLYKTFIIETKFNFSTITFKNWVLDLIKSILLSTILGGILLTALFFFLQKTGEYWWIIAWLFFVVFQLFITFISPIILAPIFFKFIPLKNKELLEKITALAEKAKFPINGVFQIDASKRSKHSNAFMAGFGKTRRIALFDTLLENHSDDEILAILAHEIGHWKKNHIPKGFIVSSISTAITLYLLSIVLLQEWLYEIFNISSFFSGELVGASVAAGLLISGVLFSPISFILQPITSWFSRKKEYEADAYSYELFPKKEALKSALINLSKDNLSNLMPHPLYVIFNYSHPAVFQRISALNRLPN